MTREDILDAAAQVFRKKGYHGASMADIAGAVNLQKASLYHHVSSKQEILLALLDRALEMLTEHISAVTIRDLTADDKLRQMILAYLSALTENIDLASVLLIEHRSLDRKLHLRHIPNRDKFEDIWRDVVKEGIKAGIFDCDDPGLAVRALMGIMNWTITWYRTDGPKSIQKIADEYTDLLFHGLLTKQ